MSATACPVKKVEEDQVAPGKGLSRDEALACGTLSVTQTYASPRGVTA